jgi:flagellar protein FliO/FliZ
MDLLFGADMPPAVRFIVAFVIVLVLIGVAAWLVRRFGADRFGVSQGRGRQPRLAVIDAAAVDSRRRLILIRRDNVEHLLLIGGPSDVVVEPNIVRATGTPLREPSLTRNGTADARSQPLGDANAWPLQPQTDVPARTSEASDDFKRWPSSEPAAFVPEPIVARPSVRTEPAVTPPPRNMAPVRAPAPRSQPAPSTAETANAPDVGAAKQNDLTQRLEASLRRPNLEERSTVPKAAAVKAPSPYSPTVSVRTGNAAAEIKPVRPDDRAAPGKSVYEDLEQEMASLLGRSPGKT